MYRSTPRLALLAVLVVLTAACGQKADVGQVSAGPGGTVAADGFGPSLDSGSDGGLGTTSGGTPTTITPGGTPTGGTSGTGGTGNVTSGTTPGGGTAPVTTSDTGTPGDGGTATPPATTATPAGDRTGITDTEIVIGIHAPVTGAAPIPQTAFEEAKDLYWRFLNESGGLFGRTVRVVFEDDQFNPRTAVDKCKKMVTEDKVFLLVGGGGADQITACAQYANSVGVPYLSAGVNEDGLVGVRAYFALSESYAQQSVKLVQMTQKMFP